MRVSSHGEVKLVFRIMDWGKVHYTGELMQMQLRGEGSHVLLWL